jgi:predicted transcriptional regulator
MNPNDEIRNKILNYFYERNKAATSRFGKKGSAVKIRDAKRELKVAHGMKQNEVMSNLTYLIDNGWVKTVEVKKTVITEGGTIPSTVTWYEITAKGIDKIEGGSQFEPKEKYAGINVTATGNNVIALGDGNVVNAKYSSLHAQLDELKAAIASTIKINEAEKLDLAVDIESIKDQLAKAQPNKTIIRQLWLGLQRVATLSSVATAYDRVKPLIDGLLG